MSSIGIARNYADDFVRDLHRTIRLLDTRELERVIGILRNANHVYVTGIGKSSIAAHKCAASFASIGMAAHFLHATEALHGDCGPITNKDVLLCLSDSGETVEILTLIKALRQQERCRAVISIVGDSTSTLAAISDHALVVSTTKDETIFTYLPTSSTTIALVLCDILLLSIIAEQHLTIDQFKLNHLGGTLGKITLIAQDVMLRRKKIPFVEQNASWTDILKIVSQGKLGCTVVVDTNDCLLGVITDGDIRRTICSKSNFEELNASDIMTSNPQKCSPATRLDEILTIMEKHVITMLPVVVNDQVVGIVHIHNVLQRYKDIKDVCSEIE